MEQWSAARIAGLATATDLTWKVFEHWERLLDLNLETMKTALAQTEDCAAKAWAIDDPQEFFALQMEWFQRAADSMLTYRYRLYSTLTTTRIEIDKAVEVAPSNGAAPALAAWQDVFNATNTFYECLGSTMTQAAKIAENNFNEAALSASKRIRNSQHADSILTASP
ncbi:hypothetical protein BLA34_12715 [Ralstonia solanacearum]|nr:hypothetical protein BLA34_12715 [Ralstonia solanacearum]